MRFLTRSNRLLCVAFRESDPESEAIRFFSLAALRSRNDILPESPAAAFADEEAPEDFLGVLPKALLYAAVFPRLESRSSL